MRISPPYSDASDSEAEIALQQLRFQLDSRCGRPGSNESSAAAWLIRHAAWLYTRCAPRPGHQTAFERLELPRYRDLILEFGELVSARYPDTET